MGWRLLGGSSEQARWEALHIPSLLDPHHGVSEAGAGEGASRVGSGELSGVTLFAFQAPRATH